MTVTGKIKLIGETQSFGKNGFTKRQVVVTTDEQYPQDLGIDFTKDKCQVLDNYQVGDNVEVSINLRGNEYNGRYFVNLQGWRIQKTKGVEQSNELQQESPFDSKEEDFEDNLPF